MGAGKPNQGWYEEEVCHCHSFFPIKTIQYDRAHGTNSVCGCQISISDVSPLPYSQSSLRSALISSEKMNKKLISLLCSLAVVIATCAVAIGDASLQTYIVHMSKSQMPSSFDNSERWHSSVMKSLQGGLDDGDGSESVLYNYNQVFDGFAAKLTREQAETLQTTAGILAVHPESVYHLHTTRTPHFLGLNDKNGAWSSQYSKNSHDIVIGVLDSGVWPESPSFADHEVKAVPSLWKGECESGTAFNASHCNKKLIGARFFCRGYEATNGPVDEAEDYRSPRDHGGHGTHTASTAAGSFVQDASLFGLASGTAGGMAPAARVAVYKVCWARGCVTSDILAAMDKAVEDGVNIMSLSLGGQLNGDFDKDGVAVGAFSAMQRGIFVSCSAGNSGPDQMSVDNVAPWITTVGASSIDRAFPASLVLGNGVRYSGVSLYSGQALPKGQMFPIIYAANASNGDTDSNMCLEKTLDPKLVKGKIVMCDRGTNSRVEKGYVVKSLGGVGMILSNNPDEGDELIADSHLLPSVAVGYKTKESIRNYIKATRAPTATIEMQGAVVGTKPAPVVAAFSSRGPSFLTPQILKPDIVAPGVEILAAWTGAAGPSNVEVDTRRVQFNIISGTSMSCPHISGIAALIKAAHPDWSPAGIRSALMTTAYTLDNTGKPLSDAASEGNSNPLAHGAGHVDPNKALDPGLIYDMGVQDYVDFLCALSYTPQQLRTITKSANATCSKNARRNKDPGNINYPSFSAVFINSKSNSSSKSAQVVKYTRTVTNVGNGVSNYRVAVSAPAGVSIVVRPTKLSFQKQYEKLSYSVTFMTNNSSLPPSFGSITWTDGAHKVTSPVAAFTWVQ